jgi:hypothetical protein
MLGEEADRLVVRCDHCPVRLDLGPVTAARARNRMPSAWISAGLGKHYCPVCAPAITAPFMLAQAQGAGPRPLV